MGENQFLLNIYIFLCILAFLLFYVSFYDKNTSTDTNMCILTTSERRLKRSKRDE